VTSISDKRTWLRSEGYEVSDRGALSAELNAIYDSAHPGGNGGAPDYPAGMTEDDFGPAPAGEPVSEPSAPPADEVAPKRPRSGRPAGRGTGRRMPWQRGAKPKGKAKPKPRVPVDEVIGGAWRIMARVAAPVPPLQRTLRVQAPVTGLLLEDAVKGTFLDAVLQPIARAQAGGKTVAALLGPPMLVTAMSVHVQRAAVAGTDPNPVFMGITMEALRESLMLWISVAGPKFEEALAREREFEEHYGRDVDEFIAFLFAPPPAPGDAAAQKAEDDAIRHAQGRA
jgi:hypothetical protein